MNKNFFGILQRVGRAFMLPIALLPVAGLMLGIGASFTNAETISTYGLEWILGKGTVLNVLLTVMSKAGGIVFINLPILFAIGVAVGMAKREKEVSGVAGAVAFFVMHATINALLNINGKLVPGAMPQGALGNAVGIDTLSMGVFGGVIVGLGVAALHNRFYKIELHKVFSFFGGTRFVPIISALTYMFVGIVMYFIWPVVQNGIMAVGELVNRTGYWGTFIYGFTERALIPFGLHHVFYMPFWQTAVGGTLNVAGKTVMGGQNIFFAQLADPGTVKFSVEATKFMAGKFPLFLFGLPGAALAIYNTAKDSKKKAVAGLLISATLTAVFTGISEPLEFSFLFAAPLLYVVHCLLAGSSFMLMHIFNVGVGQTFSGSLIDFVLFGVLQGNSKTNWINAIIVGVFYFPAYYFIFRTLILRFDLKTPGREDDEEETKLHTRKDADDISESISEGDAKAIRENAPTEDAKAISESIPERDAKAENYSQPRRDMSIFIAESLGGKDNIVDIDCCATRLRVTVKDFSKVDQEMLKLTGAVAVFRVGNGVQAIFGPHVNKIKSELEVYLDSI
ncbi:MAG: PTS transporter subunit EIIC [Clostridiaceae bacterium]